jgi:UDP-3-O-[3-hydroxymyristoyl] glucosamine N-acyltransferase
MSDAVQTLQAIADLVGGVVEGDGSVQVTHMAPIDQAGADAITFALDVKRVAQLADTGAGGALVPADADTTELTVPVIKVERVDAALAMLLSAFAPKEDLPPVGVHPTAIVDDSATLGANVAIGPYVVIGANVTIGDGTAICAHVAIGADVTIGSDTVVAESTVIKSRSDIGSRVRIGPNCSIGYDGFGYFFAEGQHHMIPHVGHVIIEDDVHLGASVCVDRGKFGPTRVGAGTKVDNLVQIAHNVQVGKCCLLVGQCGIAGSAVLGDGVVIGGSAGVRDNITVGDGAQLAAYSAAAGDIPAGAGYGGTPARDMADMRRIVAATGKLPDLPKRVKQLEAAVEAIQKALDGATGASE